MILSGSKALYINNNVLISKERFNKADYDVIMSFSDFNSWFKSIKKHIIKLVPIHISKFNAKVSINGENKNFEIEIASDNHSTSFLLNNKEHTCENIYIDPLGIKWHCLKNEYLFINKKSHINFPVHFEKSINDYHLIKNHIGQIKNNTYTDQYTLLKNTESNNKFSKQHSTPKLNVSNDDFFKISVKAAGRVYIHDDLHYVVKHFSKPIYEMIKNDNKQHMAWCDKDMFNNLPLETKIKCVQEECYVIALERYIIPEFRFYNDYLWCYKRALMRICTTLCSGFFRDFAVEHYHDIIDAYNPDFVDKFNSAIKNGYLKPMIL